MMIPVFTTEARRHGERRIALTAEAQSRGESQSQSLPSPRLRACGVDFGFRSGAKAR